MPAPSLPTASSLSTASSPSGPLPPLHPLQRLWHAEELVRRRRSNEDQRYAAPQRSGRIDPNPHQIEAVIFALARLGDGGCILADEVGLGKTIEAGLVIAQLLAEGARRVLLIAPKPLCGQWQQELYDLFGLEARDAAQAFKSSTLGEDGVFLVGREAAGSERGQAMLMGTTPFDLVVIDEAHEVFGGLYKRYDAGGEIRDDVTVAQTAGRVFDVIRASQAPVLLLTATPIQNSLTELWALVRYVDPTGTLLGDLRTFRQTFCTPGQDGDRVLAPGQADELRRRVAVVLQRTLRRQAQEFLSRPFVARQARLFEYPMGEVAQKLYDDVTTYLMTPHLCAFRGNQRRLLLIGFHRRMASSTAALAASLERVAQRLEKTLKALRAGAPPPEAESDEELLRDMIGDLEDEDLLDLREPEPADDPRDPRPPPAPAPMSPEAVAAELARVQDFVVRAQALAASEGGDGKSRALLDAARLVIERGKGGQGSGKMVIFTESVVTQGYLRDLLVKSGVCTEEEVTLFRGQNDSARAREALARWQTEVAEGDGKGSAATAGSRRPSRDIAVRLALVHEFRTRSRILISTEAGAKGLNLQFCETVINFDLPWNPQRIEQRIGRCHRYGQTRDVTVVNFMARGNEAEQLTFEILGKKLDLFGTVLDASDAVLHRPSDRGAESLASALGPELETSLNRIWERARTLADVTLELRELRDRMEVARQRFEEEQERTAGLIETYFDEQVRRVFSHRQRALPAALAALDADLERVAIAYLDSLGARYQRHQDEGGRWLHIDDWNGAGSALAGGLAGTTVALGASADHESLHLTHPLILAAVETARQAARQVARPVGIVLPEGADAELGDRRGGQGRLVGLLVRYQGLENVDRLVLVALCEGDEEPLPAPLAQALLACPLRDLDGPLQPALDEVLLEEAVDEAAFQERRDLGAADQQRFDRGLEQLERYLEDRTRLLRRQIDETSGRIDETRARRDAALGASQRDSAEQSLARLEASLESMEGELDRLIRREDETYRRCRDRLHQRRHTPAEVIRLFDVEFLLE